MEENNAHVDQPAEHRTNLWVKPIIISIGLYVLFFIFSALIDNEFTTLQASKALAGVGAMYFGTSLALGSICYFFDFADDKIGYRKQFGIIGYVYALLYSFSILLLNPDTYFYGFWKNLFTPDMFLGITSMTLFTAMVLVSNKWAMLKMGPQRWRKFLRIGFFAWFLLALRAAFLEWDLWIEWLNSLNGFPPPRMLLSLFVISVIGLRIAVEVSKRLRRSHAPPTQPAP